MTAFAVSLTLQCICTAIPSPTLSDLLFLLWIAAYLPVVSFVYARKIRYGGKRSIPYTIMHSFMHTLAFIPFYPTKEGIAAALAIFSWCELWALIGLIRKQKIPCY